MQPPPPIQRFDDYGLRDHLAHAPRMPAIFVVTVPAPVVPAETMLAASNEPTALLWAPSTGPTLSGAGQTEVVVGAGPTRFEQVRRAVESIFSRVELSATPAGAPDPWCFGGFSFVAGGAQTPPWHGFGDARFVLPRFTYYRDGGDAFFTVALRGDDAERSSIVERGVELYRTLYTVNAAGHDDKPRVLRDRNDMPPAEWQRLVGGILDHIRQGQLAKVVVARRTALRFEESIDALEVLRELERLGTAATRFAIRFASTTFLGATPERLVKKKGLRIETEALAGTIRGGAGDRALLDDPKERAEHEYVRRAIVECLAPLCVSVDFPPSPEVRAFRHIAHLRTPVSATLAHPEHVLDLVARLHPTPAVGGVPTREATSWIAAHEPVERGWYAGPVGWFDVNGDGEFDVALRSGVIDEESAYLYAGGGIVIGSDPEREYAETELKLAALSTALRVT